MELEGGEEGSEGAQALVFHFSPFLITDKLQGFSGVHLGIDLPDDLSLEYNSHSDILSD